MVVLICTIVWLAKFIKKKKVSIRVLRNDQDYFTIYSNLIVMRKKNTRDYKGATSHWAPRESNTVTIQPRAFVAFSRGW